MPPYEIHSMVMFFIRDTCGFYKLTAVFQIMRIINEIIKDKWKSNADFVRTDMSIKVIFLVFVQKLRRFIRYS